MNLLHAISPLHAVSGFVVGVLVGLTGVGGGSLMTPLLILLFGVSPSTAVGTDLIYAAATRSVGSVVHGLNRTVDWPIVARLTAGSAPAAVATVWVLSRLGHTGDFGHGLITMTLGVALMLTSVAILFRQTIQAFFTLRVRGLGVGDTHIWTIVLGAALGVLVTLSSVGAGSIGMTVLVILYPTLSTKRLVGSDIAHAVPLALIAGMGHWVTGSVNVPLLVSLLVGSIPGIIIGSALAARTSDRVLRPILAVLLAIVGLRLLL